MEAERAKQDETAAAQRKKEEAAALMRSVGLSAYCSQACAHLCLQDSTWPWQTRPESWLIGEKCIRHWENPRSRLRHSTQGERDPGQMPVRKLRLQEVARGGHSG